MLGTVVGGAIQSLVFISYYTEILGRARLFPWIAPDYL